MSGLLPSGSVRTRLSVSIAALLLAVLAAYHVLTYREVRGALSDVAEARLTTASERLSILLERAADQETVTLQALGGRPEVRAFLQEPSAQGEVAVRLVLDSLISASTSRQGMILTSRNGRTLRAGDADAVTALGRPGVAAEPQEPEVSPFVRRGESVGYSVSAPVRVDGEAVGAVVDILTLGGNPQGAETIRDLIGPEARFLVGNRSGDVWTDLAAPVDDFAPPATTRDVLVPGRDREGEDILGVTGDVGGTPWLVWVALPTSVVMQPLTSFMTRMAGMGFVLVLVGGAGAWMVGRRLTRPLTRLTAAAAAIERGELSHQVPNLPDDEIGRLGKAFERMARQIREDHDRLEQRVAERTAELRRALSDLHDAQEELVRKERLALLGELAGGVGHELRNPLGVMTNAVFYLEAVLKDRPKDIDEYLDILRSQIMVSEKIVGDLLDFARVKPPQREHVDLEGLAEGQLERAGQVEGISVRREFPPNLPSAHVDPGQVAQVILNLVTNAFQSMEDGKGTLTLRGASEDGRVRLEVEDEGPGISDPDRNKIFEPLFTTKPKGIGLGLSVSRSLAEANGGTLEVRSVAGRGATFILTLPTGPA